MVSVVIIDPSGGGRAKKREEVERHRHPNQMFLYLRPRGYAHPGPRRADAALDKDVERVRRDVGRRERFDSHPTEAAT
ncbi:hypothetical protein EYF80_056237 [Liparis tanakae]|uniref:Uncharacterized protein n=1 Tax=Liparis tanakae TaxID=230148 RepID=A0A4Z2EYD5_9TELE|nr:hypothetical protein EYF80_056237 [Liparis tanakae]